MTENELNIVAGRAGQSIVEVSVAPITPSDSTDLEHVCRGFFINGVAGTVSFIPARRVANTPTVWTLDPGYHDIACRRILATNTTATLIYTYF